MSKGISNQFIWVSLHKLRCSSKTMLPLSYIFVNAFQLSFVHSGLVWPVSAQIFILYWHITAHNILAASKREYHDTSCWHLNCRIFSLECRNVVATLPKLIKGQGRLESHNCVLIDSSLSCLSSESQFIKYSCTVASLTQACALPSCRNRELVSACPPCLLVCWGSQLTVLCTAPCIPGVLHWVECSRWKDKSAS